MYKDSQAEIKIRKRIRTYYCDCCNKELDTVENYSRFDEDAGFPNSDYLRTIQVHFDFDIVTRVKGILCDNCWTDVQLHAGKMIDEACKKFSYKKEDFNIHVQDKSDQES